MDLNNLILFFVLIAFGLFFYKYFILILDKYYTKSLIDNHFDKPQAFHEHPTSIAGGIGLFFSLLIIKFGNFSFGSCPNRHDNLGLVT